MIHASGESTTLLLKPPALKDPHVAARIPIRCPECGTWLALAETADGLFDKQNFSIICGSCGSEFLLDEILKKAGPQVLSYLPVDEEVGPEKFHRGFEASIDIGKGFGATGKDRSEILRYCVDIANDWPWNPDVPNGKEEMTRLNELKAKVGLFEDSPATKKGLEVLSRRIRRVESVRRIEIPRPAVDYLAKLLRKGIREAEHVKPTTRKDRAIAVEYILEKEGYWPP